MPSAAQEVEEIIPPQLEKLERIDLGQQLDLITEGGLALDRLPRAEAPKPEPPQHLGLVQDTKDLDELSLNLSALPPAAPLPGAPRVAPDQPQSLDQIAERWLPAVWAMAAVLAVLCAALTFAW